QADPEFWVGARLIPSFVVPDAAAARGRDRGSAGASAAGQSGGRKEDSHRGVRWPWRRKAKKGGWREREPAAQRGKRAARTGTRSATREPAALPGDLLRRRCGGGRGGGRVVVTFALLHPGDDLVGDGKDDDLDAGLPQEADDDEVHEIAPRRNTDGGRRDGAEDEGVGELTHHGRPEKSHPQGLF